MQRKANTLIIINRNVYLEKNAKIEIITRELSVYMISLAKSRFRYVEARKTLARFQAAHFFSYLFAVDRRRFFKNCLVDFSRSQTH